MTPRIWTGVYNGQTLHLWRTATGQIEPLAAWETHAGQSTAQPVEQFVVEPDGRGILLLQRDQAVDGAQRYALRRYDRVTRRVETLLNDIPHLYDLRLSPDGVWMAYQLKQQPPPHRHPWWARLFRSNGGWCGESPLIGIRYVQRLQSLGPPIQLTTCTEFDCSGVLLVPTLCVGMRSTTLRVEWGTLCVPVGIPRRSLGTRNES